MFRPKTRYVALPSPRAGVGEEIDRLTCPKCDTSLEPARLTAALGVCYRCGYHFRLRAPERVAMLVEPGSFREEDQGIIAKDVLGFKDSQPYTKRIEQSRAATGANEAVIWGEPGPGCWSWAAVWAPQPVKRSRTASNAPCKTACPS